MRPKFWRTFRDEVYGEGSLSATFGEVKLYIRADAAYEDFFGNEETSFFDGWALVARVRDCRRKRRARSSRARSFPTHFFPCY